MRLSVLLSFLIISAQSVFSETTSIPTVLEGRGPSQSLLDAANKLRESGTLMSGDQIAAQLDRKSCELTLPAVREQKLTGRQIWDGAKKSHIRVGYYYLCSHCDKWHLNLAGGYAITADGVIATCHHVVEKKNDIREGFLVAATEDDRLLPVTEVLAANKPNDIAIVRVKSETPLVPLSINAAALPGDDAYCYSDPLGRPSYFSKGIVNRYFRGLAEDNITEKEARRMNVSTDWAPGSSGSAVLDECGNVIGHVSEISSQGKNSAPSEKGGGTERTLIIFHNASCAADLLAMIHPPKPEQK